MYEAPDVLAVLEARAVRVDDGPRKVVLGDVWPLRDGVGEETHELESSTQMSKLAFARTLVWDVHWIEGGCLHLDQDFAFCEV